MYTNVPPLYGMLCGRGVFRYMRAGLCKTRFYFAAVRRTKRKGRYKTIIKSQHQINEQIRDREVRVIGADGQQLGVMGLHEALRLAEESGLDLVKISPTAIPPVCKIMDYGKYKFDLGKKEKENRRNQKMVELKEVRLSMTIDTNDLNVKSRQAQKFLESGNKVLVSIRLRGRQNAHPTLGIEVMNKFFETLEGKAVMDKKPTSEGRNITMVLSPVKQ